MENGKIFKCNISQSDYAAGKLTCCGCGAMQSDQPNDTKGPWFGVQCRNCERGWACASCYKVWPQTLV